MFYLYLITIAIFAASFTAAQDLSTLTELPQCAQNPAKDAFIASGCPLSNSKCICTAQGFQSSLTSAVMKDCSQSDQLAVLKFSQDFCSKAGVKLNIPQTTAEAGFMSSSAAPAKPPPPATSTLQPPPPPPSSTPALPPPAPTTSSTPAPPPATSATPAPVSRASASSAPFVAPISSTSSIAVSSTPTKTMSTAPPSTSAPPSATSSSVPSTSAPFFIAPAFSGLISSPVTTPSSAPKYTDLSGSSSVRPSNTGASSVYQSSSGYGSAPYPYPSASNIVAYNGTNGTYGYGTTVSFLGAAPRTRMGAGLLTAAGMIWLNAVL